MRYPITGIEMKYEVTQYKDPIEVDAAWNGRKYMKIFFYFFIF